MGLSHAEFLFLFGPLAPSYVQKEEEKSNQ